MELSAFIYEKYRFVKMLQKKKRSIIKPLPSSKNKTKPNILTMIIYFKSEIFLVKQR